MRFKAQAGCGERRSDARLDCGVRRCASGEAMCSGDES